MKEERRRSLGVERFVVESLCFREGSTVVYGGADLRSVSIGSLTFARLLYLRVCCAWTRNALPDYNDIGLLEEEIRNIHSYQG